MLLDMPIDEGFLTVKVGEIAVSIDVYKANNTYVALRDEHVDTVALGNAWCAWLAETGLPGLSHHTGFKIADAVGARVDELRKKAD